MAGYSPGRSIVLVRNPSWYASTDELRPAYADRIETTIGGTAEDIALKIDSGDIDLGLDAVPPANQVQQYTTDPDLKDRIHADPSDAVRFLEMNLANPPFDDIHIRKAMNWALDKQGFLQLRGGPIFGEIAGHIMVNSLENNLLQDYDPYATPDGGGDIQKAMDEIKQSKYDANGTACVTRPRASDVLTMSDSADPYPKQLALLQQVLEPLGITLEPEAVGALDDVRAVRGPQLALGALHRHRLGQGLPGRVHVRAAAVLAERDRSRVLLQRHHGRRDARDAHRAGLRRRWTFRAPRTQIDACIPLTGDERVQCWADLDTYLMEDVVPWVPYLFDNDVVVLSANVTSYSFDQFAGLPALDRIAVEAANRVHRERGRPAPRGDPDARDAPRRKSQACGKEPKGTRESVRA